MSYLRKNNQTLDLFLTCMLLIYSLAFASYYIQAPGLFSDQGILPAKATVKQMPNSWSDWKSQMNLLRFSNFFGLSVALCIDLCALTGIVISGLGLLFSICRSKISFAILWLLYYSLYQSGRTFLWFQWDILLLETGFLCIMSAPLFGYDKKTFRPSSGIYLTLIRWLLFRLMFSSGVVKLTSGCPTWWGLTALHWHYESQCIPTPLAWYFHHLPGWWHKWCVVATYIIEIAAPLLFFIPTRSIRLISFWCQIFLQILIILTGNYNFFNLLTIVLCLSLLSRRNRKSQPIVFVFDIALLLIVLHFIRKYFSLTFALDNWQIQSQLNFNSKDLQVFLSYAVPASIWMGGLTMLWEIVKSFYVCIHSGRLGKCFTCLLASIFAIFIFSTSLIPYSNLHRPTEERIPHNVQQLYYRFHNYHFTNSYGLFRHMTGVGGRPELVIEGSTSSSSVDFGTWQEYEFLYKPGDVNRSPPFVAPHQPRLDWQMWFAALSSYQNEPWLINLLYRLLHNEPQVLKLLDKNPFGKEAPKFVRIIRYQYHYMPRNTNGSTWWYREKPEIYLPPVSLNNENLIQHAYQQKLVSKKDLKLDKNILAFVLQRIRHACDPFSKDGFLFVLSVATVQLTLKLSFAFVLT